MTRPCFSEASARCAGVKPNDLLRSSADGGWTALLLDHHEGRGHSDIFETHPTPDLTLVVATQGEHRIAVARHGLWRTAIYQAGAMGLTPPHETTRMRWSTAGTEHPFRSVHLYLPKALIADVAEEYRRIGAPTAERPLSSLVFRDPAVAACAVALLHALGAGAPDLYAEQAGRWLAAHLLSRHAGWCDADEAREPELITDRRLARVLEYMSTNLERPLTLDQLAREAGISVHHFGRRFRERMGQTPCAHLTAMRMDMARRLLRTTDQPRRQANLDAYDFVDMVADKALGADEGPHLGTIPNDFGASGDIKHVAACKVYEEQPGAIVDLPVAKRIEDEVANEVGSGQRHRVFDPDESWATATVADVGAVGRAVLLARIYRGHEVGIRRGDDRSGGRVERSQTLDRPRRRHQRVSMKLWLTALDVLRADPKRLPNTEGEAEIPHLLGEARRTFSTARVELHAEDREFGALP